MSKPKKERRRKRKKEAPINHRNNIKNMKERKIEILYVSAQSISWNLYTV